MIKVIFKYPQLDHRCRFGKILFHPFSEIQDEADDGAGHHHRVHPVSLLDAAQHLFHWDTQSSRPPRRGSSQGLEYCCKDLHYPRTSFFSLLNWMRFCYSLAFVLISWAGPGLRREEKNYIERNWKLFDQEKISTMLVKAQWPLNCVYCVLV